MYTQLIHITVLWYMHVIVHTSLAHMYTCTCTKIRVQCSSVMHFGYYALILCMCDQKMHIPIWCLIGHNNDVI